MFFNVMYGSVLFVFLFGTTYGFNDNKNYAPGEGYQRPGVDNPFLGQYEILSTIENAPLIGGEQELNIETCQSFVNQMSELNNDTTQVLKDITDCVITGQSVEFYKMPFYLNTLKLFSNTKLKVFVSLVLCVGLLFGFIIGLAFCSICQNKLRQRLQANQVDNGDGTKKNKKCYPHYGNDFIVQFDSQNPVHRH